MTEKLIANTPSVEGSNSVPNNQGKTVDQLSNDELVEFQKAEKKLNFLERYFAMGKYAIAANETFKKSEADLIAGDEDFNIDELLAQDKHEQDRSNEYEMTKTMELMSQLMKNEFYDAVRTYKKQTDIVEKSHILSEIHTEKIKADNPRAISINDPILAKYDKIEQQAKDEIQDLKRRSPEAHYAVNVFEYMDNIRDNSHNLIIETPYVQAKKEIVSKNMKKGKATFIHGPLGCGKTEMAISAAIDTSMSRQAMKNAREDLAEYKKEHEGEEQKKSQLQLLKNFYDQNLKQMRKSFEAGDEEAIKRFSPLVIQGSDDITSQDLFSDKSLTLMASNGKTVAEMKKDVDEGYEKWKSEKLTDPEYVAELNQLTDKQKEAKEASDKRDYLELYKQKNNAFGTAVEVIEKEITRAMREGRPVIIDEINAIPSDVLISLNNILQSRPGDNAYVPGVGAVEVQDGFSVTATGNISDSTTKYVGTKEINIATLSRFDQMDYDYLPQQVEGSFESRENPEKDELFRVVLTYLADEKGNIAMPEPEKNIRKLYELSQFARHTQDIFTGKIIESSVNSIDDSGDARELHLDENVLSTRNLLTVIDKWERGRKMNLDKALWDGFISMASNDDRNLLLAQAKNFNFFSENEGWRVKAKAVGQAGQTYEEICPNEEMYPYGTKAIEVIPRKEVVDFIFGERPERTIYPDIDMSEVIEQEQSLTQEEYLEIAEKLNNLETTLAAFEVLSEQCGCSNINTGTESATSNSNSGE